METRPRLIINADDFGFSEGVNHGVVECLEGGLLGSATILVNAPGSDSALRYAREHSELGFGLHLNLIWGRPVSGPRPSLCGADGAFLSPLALLRRLLLRTVDPGDLKAEIRAQIAACVDRGVNLTHIDSHKHFHVFAPVYRVLTEVAGDFGIRRFRLPMESVAGRSALSWKGRLLRILSAGLARHLRSRRLAAPTHFCGAAFMGSAFTEARIESVIRRLPPPPAVTELMVHAGRPEAGFERIDGYVEHRSREIGVLSSPRVREALRDARVSLCDYREISWSDPETRPPSPDIGSRGL